MLFISHQQLKAVIFAHRLIEQMIRNWNGAALSPTAILFQEWGTSGMRSSRPTVGHLRDLLVLTELFRAADYVAVDLLGEQPPNRPATGPAARVDISLPTDFELEKLLNDFEYTYSDLAQASSDQTPNINQNVPEKQHHDKVKVNQSFAVNSGQSATASVAASEGRSDMIQFSSTDRCSDEGAVGGIASLDAWSDVPTYTSENVPMASSRTPSANIPNFSLIENSERTNEVSNQFQSRSIESGAFESEMGGPNVPALSALIGQMASTQLNPLESSNDQDVDVNVSDNSLPLILRRDYVSDSDQRINVGVLSSTACCNTFSNESQS